MTAPLHLHGFETSNNMKVRVALGYKGLDYDWHPIDPEKDRERIAELSGQYLTPVLVHGETVLFDSAAILRYLDANFRDTPRLYGSDRFEQWEVEDEEFWARIVLAGPMMDVVHARIAGEELAEEEVDDATQRFQEAVEELVAKLDGQRFLVGESLSAADIHAACILQRIKLSGLFPLPESIAEIDGWFESVIRHDRLRQPLP